MAIFFSETDSIKSLSLCILFNNTVVNIIWVRSVKQFVFHVVFFYFEHLVIYYF